MLHYINIKGITLHESKYKERNISDTLYFYQQFLT